MLEAIFIDLPHATVISTHIKTKRLFFRNWVCLLPLLNNSSFQSCRQMD